ncbi:MAG TPA: HK97-gp10 family putative phage morphogenesis protein [Azonexus sp.]|nr:HK97-gp10 family putative phage morphogenesis protein [Azonexus sp.]
MVEVQGMDSLFAALDRVPRNAQRKTLRRGVQRGAAMIRDEARRIVHRRSGKLAKQIRVASSRGSGQRGVVAYKVGLTKAGFYGRFLEFGHIARGPGGKLAGGTRRRYAQRVVLKAEGRFVPPYPFMRPAAEKLPRALDVVQATLAEAIRSGELMR